MLNQTSEDDTFAALRQMSFDDAVDFAINYGTKFPLGTKTKTILAETDYALRQFGWSYDKLITTQKLSTTK